MHSKVKQIFMLDFSFNIRLQLLLPNLELNACEEIILFGDHCSTCI